MARLASLVVDLQLQSAELRRGLDEANRKLEAFAKQTERTGDILAGAFSFEALKDVGTQLAEFIKAGADTADAMGELAQSVGVPVEELSKLSYAAAFSGSSTEAVAKALAKTADLMAKAGDETSEQAAMFTALGVSATDSDKRLRSTADVFSDIAQRFAETQDGAGKTALAIRLFGDEGAKLIPLLNNGKAGLAALGAEAERTGNVITEKGSASAGQFNDALDRLRKASEGVAISVAQELAPSMAAFAEEITTSKSGSEALEAVIQGLAFAVRTLASAGVAAATVFEAAGQTIGGVVAAWTNLIQRDSLAATQAVVDLGDTLEQTFTGEGRQILAIWGKSGPGEALSKDAEKAKPAADEYVAAIERTKKAAERAAEAQKKLAEEAKKAAEASAKALDEHVKGVLALERQHAAIDREVEKRRTEMAGSDATTGFADLDDALSRMAEAQKAAATMRDRASTRDREGDILGADSATRRADDLEALAEQASRAVDAFRELEMASIEAAVATDQRALELRNQFDDIDREVAQRRGGGGELPTFTDFNAALDAMAVAMKVEAEARSQAAALDREGRLGEARQALLAAEASRALAEHASAAADALARMPGDMAGMLKPTGPAFSAMMEGAEMGSAAGPKGAVVGGLVGLLSQSEAFQGALADLETVFQSLADSVGSLIEPIVPLVTVWSEVAAGLGALIGALSPIIEFVARPLFSVLQTFGIVVLSLVKAVGEVINAVADVLGFKNGLNLSGVDAALDRLANASYDAAKGQGKVAEEARKMSEGVANVPSWWRVEMARFSATDATGTRATAPPPVSIIDNSTTTIELEVPDADNAEQVAEIVLDKIEEKRNRRDGSRYSDKVAP